MRTKTGTRGKACRRGSALVMAILVSVVITGLVITLAWAGGVQAQMTTNLRNSDQAFYTAESGAQRVAWYCKHGHMGSITSPLTGSIGSYAYSASWTTVSGSTIRITSAGSLGSVAYTCYQTVTPPSSGALSAVGGNFAMHNFVVNGDVQASGNITHGGGNDDIKGKATYGGTCDSGFPIGGGTPTKAATSPPTLNYVTMKAKYTGPAHTGNFTGQTYDFTSTGVDPTNPVIYVNGTVTDPVFIGKGTLLVSGKITFSSNATVGSSSNPIYLVSQTSDVEFDGTTFTVTGGIYAAGDYVYRATTVLNGPLVLGGSTVYSSTAKPSSNITFNTGALPWFDPRASGGGGGGGTTTFASFTGPLP